uniref:Uncharacterized protein n=1 Tax=Peronospora matthiolae TaxID=2874970 RepID=A0AAV1UG42_9STRA
MGCDLLRYSTKMYHLAEPINKHKNIRILMNVFGKSKDEVHRYGLPTLLESVEAARVRGMKD